jgi:O-antigen/teichoic acid export membrane protein
MSNARRLLVGAVYTYGAQLFTIVAQFGYAALTSRLVDEEGFGFYGVALAISALFVLVSASGMSQTVGRLLTLDRDVIGTLLTYSVVVGGLVATVNFLLANPLSSAWGVPGAQGVVLLLAVNTLTAPLFGLVTGLARRVGAFKFLAAVTLSANVVGMIVGGCVTAFRPEATSLVISSLLAQTVVVVVCFVRLRRYFTVTVRLPSKDLLVFSWSLLGLSMIQYASSTLPRFGASNVLGAPAIGQWNRAEVLTTLPFQQLQTAVVPVLYPEFRHDRHDASRSRTLWPDLLCLLAWVTLPLGVIGSAVIPWLLPVVLGSEWRQAGLLGIPLCLAGGIQPATVLLSSALEAVGRLRIVVTSSLIALALQGVAMTLVFHQRSIWPAVVALPVVYAVMHAYQVLAAARSGLLSLRRLVRRYSSLLFFAVSLAVGVHGAAIALSTSSGVASAAAVIGAGAVAFRLLRWSSFPPIALARELGLLRSSPSD